MGLFLVVFIIVSLWLMCAFLAWEILRHSLKKANDEKITNGQKVKYIAFMVIFGPIGLFVSILTYLTYFGIIHNDWWDKEAKL